MSLLDVVGWALLGVLSFALNRAALEAGMTPPAARRSWGRLVPCRSTQRSAGGHSF